MSNASSSVRAMLLNGKLYAHQHRIKCNICTVSYTSKSVVVSNPSIHAQIMYYLPQPPVPPRRVVNIPPPHLHCKALTQDKRTKLHTGEQCKLRKVFDSNVPQSQKDIEDLAADELCTTHKKTKVRHIVRKKQQGRGAPANISPRIVLSINGFMRRSSLRRTAK